MIKIISELSDCLKDAAYAMCAKAFKDADSPSKDKLSELLKSPGTAVLISEDENGLNGFSVVKGDTIYLLAVKENKRGQKIGSELLRRAENIIRENGCQTVHLGGYGIYQGVPVIGNNREFFKKAGYTLEYPTWNMILDTDGYNKSLLDIHPAPDEIIYRFAEDRDMPKLLAAVKSVEPSWEGFFTSSHESPDDMILLAELDSDIAGFVILEPYGAFFDHGGVRAGTIGCVGVTEPYRRKGIGLRMTAEGAQILKDSGVRLIELLYLTRKEWYSQLGFKISSEQWFASKKL